MWTYANSIKFNYNEFTAHVKKAYENLQLPLKLSSSLAAEQAKLVAETVAKAADTAAKAAVIAANSATSSKSAKLKEAAAAMQAAVTAKTSADELNEEAIRKSTLAKEAKDSIDGLTKYLNFINVVTDGVGDLVGVGPLVDNITKMFDDTNVGIFFSGGGRGLSAARKIHMTRRTRLRLKKSRVITRRPKSSHLHHVSNASVGSTRKKRITNGSGKAISTRKI
jgi:hypothetical protein